MTPKPDFVADVLTMNNVASIEKNGLTLIRGGGRKFLCEKILTVDSFGYCEYNRTLAVACTLGDGREVMLTFCPGEQITCTELTRAA